jgi:hypothetical protein
MELRTRSTTISDLNKVDADRAPAKGLSAEARSVRHRVQEAISIQRTHQVEQPGLLPKLEETEQMKIAPLLPRASELRFGDEERCVSAKGCRFDFDVPRAAVEIK